MNKSRSCHENIDNMVTSLWMMSLIYENSKNQEKKFIRLSKKLKYKWRQWIERKTIAKVPKEIPWDKKSGKRYKEVVDWSSEAIKIYRKNMAKILKK